MSTHCASDTALGHPVVLHSSGPPRLVWGTTVERHRLGGLSTTDICFWTVLKAGSSWSRLQKIPCPMRSHFLVHRWCLLSVFPHGRRNKGALWGLFYKGTTPSTGAPPHDLIASQRRHRIPSLGAGFRRTHFGHIRSVHSSGEISQQS